MADFIQYPVVQALAWALVHFVWQGTAIGLAAFVALRATRPASARYAIGVGALALMLAAPVATFFILSHAPATVSSHQQPSAAPVAPARAEPAPGAHRDDSASTAPAAAPLRVSPEMLAIAVLSWLGGVAFFSVRLFGGWIVARRMSRHAVTPAALNIRRMAHDLSERLQIRRVVQVLESTAIAVPVMVGWLKPAIVLPVAALASLSPSQLEALLAHELAHVRRHDYLVNVLQSLAEALLFYHPAVWWMSRQVRAERELCCDDLAVGVCDRLVYATALTDLAALAAPGVALAATDGNLVQRIRRILGQVDETMTARAGLMPALALAMGLCVAVPAALASGTSASADQSQPQGEVTLIGQASAAVDQTGVAITADRVTIDIGMAEAPQSSEQTDRQRQIEELKRKIEELQKALNQLTQERGPELTAQRQEEIQKILEAQKKSVSAQQEEIQKLVEKLKQPPTAEQRRALDAMLLDLAKIQEATKRRADEQIGVARRADERARTAEWEAAQRAYEDARRQFEKGLITQAQLREYETAVKRAEAAGDLQAQAKINLAEAEQRLARSKTLYEKGLVNEAQYREAELLYKKMLAGGDRMAEAQVDREAARMKLERANELAQKGLTSQQDVERAKRDVQALQERLVDLRMEVTPESRRGGMAPAADQNQAVKRGDILRIAIQGEPDLPTTYEVTADGTIRIPFLGVTKVSGLTAADIRTAVGKQLADKKLGAADRVTVTLMNKRER
jgi:beta-lactamase regulating signal transducer with metallopeptidase domain